MAISNHEQPTVLHTLPAWPEHYQDQQTTEDIVVSALTQRKAILAKTLHTLSVQPGILTAIAQRLVAALRAGHKVLAAGNGGSAAEAQHFVAELVGRFKRERAPFAALALTTDTAILTAIANDYGYHDIFARQVYALGQPGDVLVGFSTSGESRNVLRAAEAARRQDMTVIAVTGGRSCSLKEKADLALCVPVIDTATVQELHMMVTHILCEIIEIQLSTPLLGEGEA